MTICYTVSLSNSLTPVSDFTYKNVTSHTSLALFLSPCMGQFPCCVMPVLSCPLFLSHTWIEDGPRSRNLTTELHSSGTFMSQTLTLLSECQEPEVVSDRFDYMFYQDHRYSSVHHTFLVFFHHLHWCWGMWVNEQILMQKSLWHFPF